MTLDDVLERTQWDFFWVPSHATVVDRPELAYIASDLDIGYLNAVTRTRASDYAPLLDEVQRAHPRRSRWMVPATFDTTALEAALVDRGYAPGHVHHACAIEPDAYRSRPGFTVRVVDDMATLSDCVAVGDAAFGLTSPPPDLGDLAGCTRPDGRVRRFVVYDGDTPLACGGLNVYPTLRFGFLWGGGTIPEARGRGVYSALLTARIDFARRIGLSHVGLYARADTSAPIVEAQGFRRYGTMTYYER